MAKMWETIKDTSAIGLQFLKEKAGAAQIEINPEYQAACEKYSILKDRLKRFNSDIDQAMIIIPKIYESANGITSSINSIEKKVRPEGPSQPAAALEVFFAQTKKLADEDFVKLTKTRMEAINIITEQLHQLHDLKAKRRQNQLLSASLADKCESLSKKDKTTQLAETKIRLDLTNDQLEKETNEFIQRVNAMWEQRFTMIEQPLQDFIGIVFSFCQKVFSHLQALQQSISPQELDAEYQPDFD